MGGLNAPEWRCIINNVEWPGTNIEKMALLTAVSHNCGCDKPMGYTIKQAGCHDLLMPNHDRWCHLVFQRRRAGTLLVQELGPQRRIKPLPLYDSRIIKMIYLLGAQ